MKRHPIAAVHDHGDRWDEADDRALAALLDKGATLAEAARAIGRTRAAAASRLYRKEHPQYKRRGR